VKLLVGEEKALQIIKIILKASKSVTRINRKGLTIILQRFNAGLRQHV